MNPQPQTPSPKAIRKLPDFICFINREASPMHENFIHPHPRSTLLKCWLVKAGRWEHFPLCFEVALQPCAASFATACDGKWKSAALLFPCECVACLTGKLQPGLESLAVAPMWTDSHRPQLRVFGLIRSAQPRPWRRRAQQGTVMDCFK